MIAHRAFMVLHVVAMFSVLLTASRSLAQDSSTLQKKDKCSPTGLLMRFDDGKQEWVPTYKSCAAPVDNAAPLGGGVSRKQCRGGREFVYNVAAQSWQQVYNPCLKR